MTPSIILYSVREVRDWLLYNRPCQGLDCHVISPQRAWSIIHNPYVKDDDKIVAAIFEGNELAAYSACFPDMIDGKRVWWYSTLFCRNESTGRGFGILAIGSLHEEHNGEAAFDMNGAEETQEIFTFLDCKLSFVKRYVFSEKAIHRNTLKGYLAHIVESFRQLRYFKYRLGALNTVRKSDYTLKYVSHIDENLYKFIIAHKNRDVFLRSKEMLNWILLYPFSISSPLMNRVDQDNHFSSNSAEYELKCICVYQKEELLGLYIIRLSEKCLSIKYLYYKSEAEQIVFTSVLEHILHYNIKYISTLNNTLAEYLTHYHLTGIQRIELQSFSYPKNFAFSEELSIQGGDGDVFV